MLKLSPDLEQDVPSSQRESFSNSETEFLQKKNEIEDQSREGVSKVLFEKKEETRKPGKIIELPKANINVGSISNKKYERRHGLREESLGKRVLKKYITKPVGTASLAVGDLLFKSYIRGKKDMLDFIRLRWSDKKNNYKSGAIPLPFRATLGIGGSMNVASTLIGNTPPGKKIIDYRKNRRGRVDRFKQWVGAPFRRIASKTSSRLPLYKERYSATQAARQRAGKFAQREAKLDSWINGGIKGWIARRKQKKYLRQKQKRKGDLSATPNIQNE